MSARVFNPMIMSEIALLRSPAAARRPRPASSVSAARVKRDLFGPVDKDESKKFIDRELAAQNEKLSQKWGFNFQSGEPMEYHPQYQWERVPPTVAPSCFTPGMIISRAAHVVHQSSTASEDLLDQRAERENENCFRKPASPVTGSVSESETNTYHTPDLRDERSSPSAAVASRSNVSTSSFPASAQRAQRQQRITDYLKERKRSSTGAAKVALAKKARHMPADASVASPSASSSIISATDSQSLTSQTEP